LAKIKKIRQNSTSKIQKIKGNKMLKKMEKIMEKKVMKNLLNRKDNQKKIEITMIWNKKLWYCNMGFWIVVSLGSLIINLVYHIIWLKKGNIS